MGKLVEIKTEDVGAIKSLFELLKDVFDDVNIECIRDDEMNNKKDTKTETEEADKKVGGIKISVLDKTKTLYVNVKLNAKKFDVFKMKKKVYDIGISLNQLHKSLKSLQKDDSLTISVNEEDKDYLLLNVKNENKKYETLDKIKLMDINKTVFNLPSVTFDAVVTIDTAEFHSICKDMSHIQNVIQITCTKKCLTFTSTGDSSHKNKSYYPDDTNGITINFDKSCENNDDKVVQGIFELKFLVMFTNKSQNLCPKIQLFMKNNFPLCVKFTVASLGKLLFCVSPYNEERKNKDFEDDDDEYNKDNKNEE